MYHGGSPERGCRLEGLQAACMAQSMVQSMVQGKVQSKVCLMAHYMGHQTMRHMVCICMHMGMGMGMGMGAHMWAFYVHGALHCASH